MGHPEPSTCLAHTRPARPRSHILAAACPPPRRSGSRSASYSLHAVGEALRLAFNGTASMPAPEDKPAAPIGPGGIPGGGPRSGALGGAGGGAVAGGIPRWHTSYKVHVHLQKNKVGLWQGEEGVRGRAANERGGAAWWGLWGGWTACPTAAACGQNAARSTRKPRHHPRPAPPSAPRRQAARRPRSPTGASRRASPCSRLWRCRWGGTRLGWIGVLRADQLCFFRCQLHPPRD